MDIFHNQNKKISFYTPLAASLGVINTNDCFYFPFLLNSFTWCSGRKRTTAGLNPWTTDVDLQTGNIGSIPQTCATTNEFDTFFILSLKTYKTKAFKLHFLRTTSLL